MYCIKCGVELKDSEEKCPLCGTVVFHPDMKRPDGEKPYPAESRRPAETASRSGMLFITSIMFLVPRVTAAQAISIAPPVTGNAKERNQCPFTAKSIYSKYSPIATKSAATNITGVAWRNHMGSTTIMYTSASAPAA